jgi:hypothetical protein
LRQQVTVPTDTAINKIPPFNGGVLFIWEMLLGFGRSLRQQATVPTDTFVVPTDTGLCKLTGWIKIWSNFEK